MNKDTKQQAVNHGPTMVSQMSVRNNPTRKAPILRIGITKMSMMKAAKWIDGQILFLV